MTLDLEKAIEEAIVKRFFEPSWMMTTQYVMDPQSGHQSLQPMNTQIPAPMTAVAEAIYKAAQAEIIRKVMEKLDIDAIVAEWAPIIAKDVITQLQKEPERWMARPSKSEREKMLEKVYEAVAEEFGRQCVEHLRKTGGLMSVLEGSKEKE